MEINLNKETIDAIARRVIELQTVKPEEYLTVREAASILKISPDRLRRIKHLFRHTKVGENGKLLFLKTDIIKS